MSNKKKLKKEKHYKPEKNHSETHRNGRKTKCAIKRGANKIGRNEKAGD